MAKRSQALGQERTMTTGGAMAKRSHALGQERTMTTGGAMAERSQALGQERTMTTGGAMRKLLPVPVGSLAAHPPPDLDSTVGVQAGQRGPRWSWRRRRWERV
jgi:hypothetical protein